MFFYRQRRKKPQSNYAKHSLFAKIATTGLHTGITFAAKKRKMKTDTKTKKPERKSVFLKLVEDKKAISECIRMGGDLSKLAKERGLKFAKPL